MISTQTVLLAVLAISGSAFASPMRFRREVPQEHSHEQFLTTVRESLNLNNPDEIQDPVFGLLGDAAAITGAGKITDPACLQQAVADQAFTNSLEADDVDGMVAALVYRSLERNSGTVGGVTETCTSIAAVNPEIAAIQQHQDPASTDAAAVNKAITLELAKQIASVGGDPQLALQSGTFAPGELDDPTGAGNTCNDADDAVGCIFTLGLLVEDASADEIAAAVAGVTEGVEEDTEDLEDTEDSKEIDEDSKEIDEQDNKEIDEQDNKDLDNDDDDDKDSFRRGRGRRFRKFRHRRHRKNRKFRNRRNRKFRNRKNRKDRKFRKNRKFGKDRDDRDDKKDTSNREEEDTYDCPTDAPTVTSTYASETSRQATTTSDAPAKTSRKATTTSEAPAETSREATTTSDAPAETSEEATTTSEAPAETSEEATTTSDAPAETSRAATTTSEAPAETTGATGDNLQTFNGDLGGLTAPAVTEGGRGFQVEGSDDFLNVAAALGRSCDIQHNKCANAANTGADFSVADCDVQNNECRAAI